jgi:predicted enzyme related to lactoylglutathione lyase
MGNPVMQWQMIAKEPEALSRFYESLFGWQMRADNALGYREIDTQSPRGINGGIWPAPSDGHSLVQLFVEVDDIDAFVAKATTLGATVLVPGSQLPDGDAIAILLDPAGLSFGLYRPRNPTPHRSQAPAMP